MREILTRKYITEKKLKSSSNFYLCMNQFPTDFELLFYIIQK